MSLISRMTQQGRSSNPSWQEPDAAEEGPVAGLPPQGGGRAQPSGSPAGAFLQGRTRDLSFRQEEALTQPGVEGAEEAEDAQPGEAERGEEAVSDRQGSVAQDGPDLVGIGEVVERLRRTQSSTDERIRGLEERASEFRSAISDVTRSAQECEREIVQAEQALKERLQKLEHMRSTLDGLRSELKEFVGTVPQA